MKLKTIQTLLLFCSLSFSARFAIAQSPVNQIGGRSIATSGASLTQQDIWAQYHNQAAMAYLKGARFGFAYQNSFFVDELSTKSVAFALPLKSGVFGLNYYYFGYPRFNENKIGLSFAKLLGKRLALGGQIDYFYTHIDGEYGQKGLASGELGIIAEPVDNLFIGAHIFNLWNSKLSAEEELYLPTIFKLGASYLLYEKANLSMELEKDLAQGLIFKTGLELELVSKLYFRAGIAAKPATYSFGLGYTFQSFQLDIAFARHPVLDYSPGISIVYAFKDRL